eukprot:CAMPEP_0117072746 /NCGR_PEP_ID=MMETSP0472-20121206/51209_1 /TAXON_ID=693140 ORGANISM="Tiarina fusus, Strain LIS" /NCGR_SAMPLE_ID=MMETSP0472 /ASSEMBLY_ACC=CAM_ASM_000603 /LENGTH=89 /DNA_ID=CAMNT_0004796989 /DNA_START=37 /DNA_END=303 /DNA_ORIENTATION=-
MENQAPSNIQAKPTERHWKGVHQDWVYVEKKKMLSTRWKKSWCAIGKTGILYIFKAADAPKPAESIDLTSAFVKDNSSGHTNVYEFELA